MLIFHHKPTRYFEFDSNRFQFDKLKDAIEYLHLFIRKTPSRLFNFEEDNVIGYDALNFIGCCVATFRENINFEIFAQNEFDETFSILLDYFYTHRNEINFNVCVQTFDAQYAQNLDELQMHSFTNLIFILNQAINSSNKTRVNFVKQYKGLETCLMFLNDQEFLSKNMGGKIYDYGDPLDLADYLIMIIGRMLLCFF